LSGADRSARPASGASGLIRHEERVVVGRDQVEAGRVTLHKVVESVPVEDTLTASAEQFDHVEHVPVTGEDSGRIETLEDGSISIPLFEEQYVIERRIVVRERVIVSKGVEVERRVIQTELRRERITVDEPDPG
jgi:stress response protein YsnF